MHVGRGKARTVSFEAVGGREGIIFSGFLTLTWGGEGGEGIETSVLFLVTGEKGKVTFVLSFTNGRDG